MLKVMPITIAVAAAVLAAPGAQAQVTSNRDSVVSPWPQAGRVSPAITRADTAYIRQVLRSNYMEAALGYLADTRADNSSVEDFAERMVSEHNKLNEPWRRLADEQDMDMSQNLGPAEEQTLGRLRDLDGSEFDQAYMTEMIRRHEQDLAAFQRIASSARSPEVRQLASTGMTTSREHLTLAQQVGSRTGVSTTAGRAGGVTTPEPTPQPTGDSIRRRTTVDRTAADDREARDDRDDRGDRDDRDARGELRGEDRAFINNVLQDHLMHIQLAELARREARSDDTRRLAKHMEDEFEEWHERWEDLAKRHDVRVPSRLGPLHREKVERLERASKGNVDRTYTRIVADHLASVVPYFEKEGQAVRPAAARRLVDDELPVIRDILAGVRGMQKERGNADRE